MWKPHTRVTTKISWNCIIRAFRIEFTCIFTVWKLFFMCSAGDDVSYVRFRETNDKYFMLRHGTKMRHRNLRSDSVLVHTGYMSTGAILVPGFGTQPYLNVCNTEIIMCGWKDCLCCSSWISMNVDLNVFNTCFTSRVSVELEQYVFCCRPYQWMTAFTSEAWWWPTLWFISMGSNKTCLSHSTDTRDVK